MEGPRGTRIEEKESLKKCVGTVFRPTLWDEYPQLFSDDNLENCRVMVHNGQVVTHIGMLVRDASLLGCTIRACNIGGVGTLPEFRKMGLATQTFADACAKARRDGCDIMIVSGDRNLYRMAGCRKVGRDFDYVITREDVRRMGDGFSPCCATVSLESAADKDQALIPALYQREPVRFIRPREDYQRAMRCRFVMNRPSDFWLIKHGGSVVAYVIFNRPQPTDKQTRLAEYAGSRCALVGALPLILAHYKLERLSVHVLGTDTGLQALLNERHIAATPTHGSGTVRIVNFPQLMERMRPHLAESLGSEVAYRLLFAEEADRFIIASANERAEIKDRGDVVRLLFGTPDNSDAGIIPEDHPVMRALRPALPFPALWYGISYV
jgi:GNAT superfamily N-acetyltransferase